MRLEYVPLLKVQRDLHDIPRGEGRFRRYLRTVFPGGGEADLLPLLAMNPMGRGHVAALLDDLLALDADRVGAEAVTEGSPALRDVPGDVNVALVVADDLMGGGTNRYDYEFAHRFRSGPVPATLPRWAKRFWVTVPVWSSEPASAGAVRQVAAAAVYRLAYTHRPGPARTLRDMLTQEGAVMAAAGCSGPALDPDDVEYTRWVLEPFLGAADMRTCVECLFGDAAGATLGFTPRGLSPRAGLAMALHDARAGVSLPGPVTGPTPAEAAA